MPVTIQIGSLGDGSTKPGKGGPKKPLTLKTSGVTIKIGDAGDGEVIEEVVVKGDQRLTIGGSTAGEPKIIKKMVIQGDQHLTFPAPPDGEGATGANATQPNSHPAVQGKIVRGRSAKVVIGQQIVGGEVRGPIVID